MHVIPNERLSAPSICFVCVLVCRKLYPHLGVESWITGVCSPDVISLCDFAYYVFGQEPAVAMHLARWYVALVSMMFRKILMAVCLLVGMVV